MNRQMLTGILLGAVVISGCVSVESTRAQLASDNPSDVTKAEETIYKVVTTGRDPSGFLDVGTAGQLEYLDIASRDELLLKIIDGTRDPRIIKPAIAKLDFSKPGLAKDFVENHLGSLQYIVSYDQRGNENCDEQNALKKKIISMLTEDEILGLLGHSSQRDEEFEEDMEAMRTTRRYVQPKVLSEDTRILLARQLIEKTENPRTLLDMLDGVVHVNLGYGIAGEVEARISEVYSNVADAPTAERLLKQRKYDYGGDNVVDDPEKRIVLLKRLPEEKMVDFALKDIEEQHTRDWDIGDISRLKEGLLTARASNNSINKIRLTAAVFWRVNMIKDTQDAASTVFFIFVDGWGTPKDRRLLNELRGLMPEFTDKEMHELVLFKEKDKRWENISRFFVDKVSVDLAYEMLVAKECKSAEMEVAFIGRLPTEKVTMDVYHGARTDEGRKAAASAMLDETKALLATELEQEYAKYAQVISEIENGDALLAWINNSNQTALQKDKAFSALKGKTVIMKGKVRNAGKTAFREIPYVSLRVEDVFDILKHAQIRNSLNINIQFNLKDANDESVMNSRKGAVLVMRGTIYGIGDIEDDAECTQSESFSEQVYIEALEAKKRMQYIER